MGNLLVQLMGTSELKMVLSKEQLIVDCRMRLQQMKLPTTISSGTKTTNIEYATLTASYLSRKLLSARFIESLITTGD